MVEQGCDVQFEAGLGGAAAGSPVAAVGEGEEGVCWLGGGGWFGGGGGVKGF